MADTLLPTATITGMDTATTIEPASRTDALPTELFLWLSPAFPVGSFAFSHGLEKLVEDRAITDKASLLIWLADLAQVGSLHNDLLLLAEAWRATRAQDRERLAVAADLAAALQPGSERQAESLTQGRGFIAAALAAWELPTLTFLAQRALNRLAYPICIGTAAADRGIGLLPTLEAYAVAFCSNLTSAAIRLSVIGQFDAQRIHAALMPVLKTAALDATAGCLEDIGSACFAADFASLAHETQHTRLFRS